MEEPATPPAKRRPGRPPGPCNEAELAARRANAQHSTGPRTEEGKTITSRNGWKTGAHSALAKQQFLSGANSVAQMFGKPCLRTCPIHPDNPNRDPDRAPCSLVLDGLTNVGGNCLDKTVYVNAFTALMDAMDEGSMGGVHGLMAAEGAAMLQLLHEVRASVSRDGVMLKIPAMTKEGKLVRDADGEQVIAEYKPNPLLATLTYMFDKLGLSLPEMLATPQSRSRAKTGEAAADTFQTLLGGIMQRAGARTPPAGNGLPALPHEPGDE